MIKKMVFLSITMLMLSPEIFANIGGRSLNVIGSNGGGVQKVVTPIEQFHASDMSKHPNMLEQGQWISVTFQAGINGDAPIKRGAALKLISSKAVKPGTPGGMMINVYEASTPGRARITLSSGAIYKFVVEGVVMKNNVKDDAMMNNGMTGNNHGTYSPGSMTGNGNTNSPYQNYSNNPAQYDIN